MVPSQGTDGGSIPLTRLQKFVGIRGYDTGPIPVTRSYFINIGEIGPFKLADVAQLVEQHFRKVWVVGSNPTIGSVVLNLLTRLI